MLSFGPLSVRLGRKRTFALMHLAALVLVVVLRRVTAQPATHGPAGDGAARS